MDLNSVARLIAGIVTVASILMLVVNYIEERTRPSQFWLVWLFVGVLILLISYTYQLSSPV